jgi:cold shock CspA family protein
MKKEKGIVININRHKNIGFIREEGTDEKIFFHQNGVIGPGFNELKEGHQVEYMKVKYQRNGEEHIKAIGVEVVFSL